MITSSCMRIVLFTPFRWKLWAFSSCDCILPRKSIPFSNSGQTGTHFLLWLLCVHVKFAYIVQAKTVTHLWLWLHCVFSWYCLHLWGQTCVHFWLRLLPFCLKSFHISAIRLLTVIVFSQCCYIIQTRTLFILSVTVLYT